MTNFPEKNLPFDPHSVHFGEGNDTESGEGGGGGRLGFSIEEHDLHFIQAAKLMWEKQTYAGCLMNF